MRESLGAVSPTGWYHVGFRQHRRRVTARRKALSEKTVSTAPFRLFFFFS